MNAIKVSAGEVVMSIRTLLDNEGMKTSPIMYDGDNENHDKKVTINAMMKDENGILFNYKITVEATVPPSNPELHEKKSKLYKDLFEKP